MTVKEIKPEPNQTVIKILEDLLVDAKKGRIQSIAIAGTMSDCYTFNVFDAQWYPVGLIGEIRLLERDVIDCSADIRRAPAWEYCE